MYQVQVSNPSKLEISATSTGKLIKAAKEEKRISVFGLEVEITKTKKAVCDLTTSTVGTDQVKQITVKYISPIEK